MKYVKVKDTISGAEFVIPNTPEKLQAWSKFCREPGSPQIPSFAICVNDLAEMAKVIHLARGEEKMYVVRVTVTDEYGLSVVASCPEEAEDRARDIWGEKGTSGFELLASIDWQMDVEEIEEE